MAFKQGTVKDYAGNSNQVYYEINPVSKDTSVLVYPLVIQYPLHPAKYTTSTEPDQGNYGDAGYILKLHGPKSSASTIGFQNGEESGILINRNLSGRAAQRLIDDGRYFVNKLEAKAQGGEVTGSNNEQDQIVQEIIDLLKAAQQGNPQAQKKLAAIQQAAQQGNPQAKQMLAMIQQVMQEMQGGTAIAKCGTKLKKKTTNKTIKKASRGCACKTRIAKLGTKLIEVDCNGIPVAKKGCKVRKGDDGLMFKQLTKDLLADPYKDAATTHTEGIDSHYYLGNDGNWYNQKWTQGENGADGTWGTATKVDPKNLQEVEQFFSTGTPGNQTLNLNMLASGLNIQTGKFDTSDNAKAALGPNYKFDQSNTRNYGFTITRDNNIEGTPIVGATLSNNAERIARQQLRKDRRDLRAYAKTYGQAYDGGTKKLRKDLGLDSRYSVRQLMNGEGNPTSWLSQRAVSALNGIGEARKYGLENFQPGQNLGTSKVDGTTNTSMTGTTNRTPVQLNNTKSKGNIGSGALTFKQGGSVKKLETKDQLVKSKCGKKLHPLKTKVKKADMGIKTEPAYPDNTVYYQNGKTGKSASISIKKLEGKQLPVGTVLTQSVNGNVGARNSVGGFDPSTSTYLRTIKYGVTPLENDTSYRRISNATVGNPNTSVLDPELGFNQKYYIQR